MEYTYCSGIVSSFTYTVRTSLVVHCRANDIGYDKIDIYIYIYITPVENNYVHCHVLQSDDKFSSDILTLCCVLGSMSMC